MEQPVTPAAPPAEAPARPELVERAPTPQIDIAKVKSMLNLPETASDIELITALVDLVAGLQQKYEALLADAVQLEDKLTNRDLADFPDLITPETQEFWRNQFLTNREGTLAVLSQIRSAKPATNVEAPKPAPRVPLRNRLADQPRTVAEVAEPAAPAASVAFKIRNRAAEICKAERVNFAQAFARAEKELTPQ